MGVLSEVATTVAESDVTRKRLRLKVLVKKPANGACKPSQIPQANCLKNPPIVDRDKKLVGTNVRVIGVCQFSEQLPRVGFEKSSVTLHRTPPVVGNRKLNSIAGSKRRTEEVLESHEPKRLKMDCSATIHCQAVLAMLMSSDHSIPFHTPVEPGVWDAGDYFDIIKKPMDLGTIEQKLHQLKYIGAEEFEADVRLTFSNAMLYNPPSHWVHKSAKELVEEFDSLWKPVKMKLDREHKDPRTARGPADLKKLSVQRKCSDLHPKDFLLSKIHSDCKPIDFLSSKAYSDCKPRDSLSLKTHSDCKPRDSLSSKTHSDCKPKDSLSLKKARSDCNLRDILSSKTHSDCKPRDSLSSKTHSDCKPKDSLSSETHSEFSGPVSRLHKSARPMSAKVKCENAPGNKIAHDDFNAVKVTVLDFELSPSKALRVAQLKSRFAETILKAQHHTLLEPGGEADKTIWQQEKESLQRKQHEEKARMEARIKAAESAAKLKEKSELKRQRQEAREGARMAIRKMERSVDVDDNYQVLKDLEALIGTSLVVMCHDRRSCATMWGVDSDKLSSPLERLGLYIKEEYSVGGDDDDYTFLEEDREEGELIC